MDEEPGKLRQREKQRKSGRVRMMKRDVVLLQRGGEQRFVPIPHRMREGQEARQRHSQRQDEDDRPMATSQRFDRARVDPNVEC